MEMKKALVLLLFFSLTVFLHKSHSPVQPRVALFTPLHPYTPSTRRSTDRQRDGGGEVCPPVVRVPRV